MRLRYQFTIRRLLMLSTAIAVCMATARSLNMPPLMQGVVAVYSSLLAIWAVMRWPVLLNKQREIRQRRLEFLEHRRALAAEVQQRKAAHTRSQVNDG